MNPKTFNDSETLAQGQQVITVAAFIHHQFSEGEKLFFPRRTKSKKFMPDVFELPGGHIDFGEELIVGLVREIKEEFQMNIRVGDPFAAFTYMNGIKGSHSIEVVYFAQFIDPLEKIILNPEDHSEFVWVDENELDKIVMKHEKLDDQEIPIIKRGFRLLAGEKIKF